MFADFRKNPPTVAFLIYAASILLLLLAIYLYPVVVYEGPRSYFDISDLPKHIGMISAIVNSGVPPDNPFFHADSPANYYYFFYLLPAALHQITFKTLDPYYCFVATALLLTTLWLFYLYYFIRRWTGSDRSATLCTIFATTASGLDLLAFAWHSHTPAALFSPGLIEAWESPTMTAMMNPFFFQLFYPQHLAALLMTLVICGCISRATPQRWQFALIGVALFVAFGLSFFIGGVALLSCWVMSLWQRRWQLMWGFVVAAILIAMTFLPNLLYPNADKLVQVAVAKIGGLPQAAFFSHWFAQATWARLLDLPLHLFLEIGIIFLVSVMWLWRMRCQEIRFDVTGRFALVLSSISLLIVSFVRIDGIYNDISMKLSGTLTLGVILLAAKGLADDNFFRGWKRYATNSAIVLALWSTLLMAWWRLSPMTYTPLTPETLAAHRWITANLPKEAIIQRGVLQEANPGFPYFALRLTAVSDQLHAGFLAHRKQELLEQSLAIERLFQTNGADKKCRAAQSLKINYLYVGVAEQRAYPSWQDFLDADNFATAYRNDGVMIVQPTCGSAAN